MKIGWHCISRYSKFTFTLMAVCMLLFSVFITSCSQGEIYKIGIAQFVTAPSLDACRQGFIDQMAEEGFIDGENVSYDYLNAEKDMSVVSTIAQKFVSEPVDLIFAITTPSSQACSAAAEGTEIPIVFGCVTDPLAAGIIESWQQPGGNTSGVSDWTEIAPQLELIMEICPDVKKLGTIYNSGEINSVVQVDELRQAAGDFGITDIVEVNASTTAEVITAAESIINRVDAIWIATDSTAGVALEAIVKVCENNKVPLFIANPAHIGRGVIAAIGIDPYYLGRESGKIASRALRGEDIGNISVDKCPLTDLAVDLAAAERMGVSIPQSVLDRASTILNE